MAKSADVTVKANVIYGAIHLCGDYSCPWVALWCVCRQAYRTHQLTPGLKSCILNTRMHSHGHDKVCTRGRACAQVWHSKQSLTASRGRSIKTDVPLQNIVKFCHTPSHIPPPFSSLLHPTQCLHKSPKHKAVSSSSGIYQTWFLIFWTAYIMHQHKG